MGKIAFFSAYENELSRELWVTDGTEAGTRLVKNISMYNHSDPNGFADLGNGSAVFYAHETNDSLQMWRSDGTYEGTVKLRDFGATGPMEQFTDYRFREGWGEIVPIKTGLAVFAAQDEYGVECLTSAPIGQFRAI